MSESLPDPTIEGLDLDAWRRWVAYRTAIRKPIKPISANAMALKLSRFGKDQAEVVHNSISNQWQGLFEIDKKPAPRRGEKVEKSEADREREREQLSAEDEKSAKGWSSIVRTPYGQLLLAEALLSRYSIEEDSAYLADRVEQLRLRVGELIREAEDKKEIAGDPRISSMVRVLFGESGYRRLKEYGKNE